MDKSEFKIKYGIEDTWLDKINRHLRDHTGIWFGIMNDIQYYRYQDDRKEKLQNDFLEGLQNDISRRITKD